MAAPMLAMQFVKFARFLPPHGPVDGVLRKSLHVTSINAAGGHWRKEFGLSENPNRGGRLSAEYPDYSYCDGRPTPIPSSLVRKNALQKKYAGSVLKALKEVDQLKSDYERKLLQESDRKRAVLDSKLKPKGELRS